MASGGTVTLEVVIGGDPDCAIEWFMNGVDVADGGRYSFVHGGDGQHSLVIRDVTDGDEGQYCCAAHNEAGRITCDGYVTVEEEAEPCGEMRGEWGGTVAEVLSKMPVNNPFTPKFIRYILPTFKEKCISEV